MPLTPRTGISRTFRSGGPGVGDRVVIRRRVPGTEREATDVIGHVLSLRPLVVRPQEVGGLPSQAPGIEIDSAAVLTVRLMPERTVKNSEIRACEVAAARALPGSHQKLTRDGGWLMRHDAGSPDSLETPPWVNSAVPVGRAAGFRAVPTSEITDFYARYGKPATLQIPERIARPAERLVGAAEWTLGPEVIVMTRPLDPPAASGLTVPRDKTEQSLPEGFRIISPAATKNTAPANARILDPAGTVVISAQATITRDDVGELWVGLRATDAGPDYREAGLEDVLVREILRWGAVGGATRAFTQVVHTDRRAIARYRAAGFAEHHRHRHARRCPDDQSSTPKLA